MNIDKMLQNLELSEQIADRLLRELPEDKFRIALFSAAELFRKLKIEAERRGIWDDIKTKKA